MNTLNEESRAVKFHRSGERVRSNIAELLLGFDDVIEKSPFLMPLAIVAGSVNVAAFTTGYVLGLAYECKQALVNYIQ